MIIITLSHDILVWTGRSSNLFWRTCNWYLTKYIQDWSSITWLCRHRFLLKIPSEKYTTFRQGGISVSYKQYIWSYCAIVSNNQRNVTQLFPVQNSFTINKDNTQDMSSYSLTTEKSVSLSFTYVISLFKTPPKWGTFWFSSCLHSSGSIAMGPYVIFCHTFSMFVTQPEKTPLVCHVGKQICGTPSRTQMYSYCLVNWDEKHALNRTPHFFLVRLPSNTCIEPKQFGGVE